MAARDTVTIGLPFHNCEATLADAIRSVFAQTDPDWELVLVDDGSTDGSLALASRVCDPRVVVMSDGVHRGLSHRLNEIAAASRGQFVARMDADDLMHPQRIARQREFLQRRPDVDAVGSTAFVIGSGNEVTGCRGDLRFDASPRAVLEQGLFIHPTVMGRREWFLRHPYDPRFVRAEDRELWCRTAATATFGRIDDALLFYREAGRVNLGNYLQSCATDREIFRLYGPRLVGAGRTSTLIARSHLKAACYRTADLAGRSGLLLRRRSRVLARIDRDTASGIVRHILTTAVPGLNASAGSACGAEA